MAFLLLGIISLGIGLANFACASEPRSFDSKLPFGSAPRKAAESSALAKLKATLWDIKSVVAVPTFGIIIVQVKPRCHVLEAQMLLEIGCSSWEHRDKDRVSFLSAMSRK